MLFMVIERFHNREAKPIYERFKERGRMMPEGLDYVESWVETDFNRCFQLMRTADPDLFAQWTAQWEDLMDFEIVPVMSSNEAIRELDEIHEG